uniref:Uncharacterized protein n=1 Tax=Caenorhabditis japonica TaxID=281687 RepID=A0A8R1EFG3_CAEJA
MHIPENLSNSLPIPAITLTAKLSSPTTSIPRPKFYRSESEMSPGPTGGISPTATMPDSGPIFGQHLPHHAPIYHTNTPGKLRGRSPRLSVSN